MVREKNRFFSSLFWSALICAILVYAGIIKVNLRSEIRSLIPSSDIVSVMGYVVSNPVKHNVLKKYSFVIEPVAVKNRKGIVSSCRGRMPVFIDEKTIESMYPGKLFSEDPARNDSAIECGNLIQLQIRWKEKGFLAIKSKSLGYSDSIIGKINCIRAKCRMKFRNMMYAWKDAGGLLLALVSGEREYLSEKMQSSFTGAGITHILALSGMHLSIMLSLVEIAGKKLLKKKELVYVQIITMSLFIWFAGLSPSLTRAFIFRISITIFLLFSVPVAEALNLLSLSFLLHLVFFPGDMYTLSFILSYSALAGIFLFEPLLERYISKCLPGYVCNSLSTSMAAQITTMPLSALYFNTVIPVGVIASMVISPLICFFIYTGIISIALCLLFPVLTGYAGTLLGYIYSAIEKVSLIFSYFPKICIL